MCVPYKITLCDSTTVVVRSGKAMCVGSVFVAFIYGDSKSLLILETVCSVHFGRPTKNFNVNAMSRIISLSQHQGK